METRHTDAIAATRRKRRLEPQVIGLLSSVSSASSIQPGHARAAHTAPPMRDAPYPLVVAGAGRAWLLAAVTLDSSTAERMNPCLVCLFAWRAAKREGDRPETIAANLAATLPAHPVLPFVHETQRLVDSVQHSGFHLDD